MVKPIDTNEYISMLRSIVEEGKEVSLTISGSSMAPFLIHHRDRIFFSKPEKPLKRGDMVFFQRMNGQYVMHRIRRVAGPDYYLIGDAQTETEGPVRREQIFAVVNSVQRKGKRIVPGDFWWRFFAGFWLVIIPFRRMIMNVYRIFLK